MAAETNETSTDDERDQSASSEEGQTREESGNRSQEQMAEDFEQAKQEQYKESAKKAGSIILIASVLLGVIGLIVIYLGSTVQDDHPLATQGLSVLGVANLVLALVVHIRKNWPRTLVLVAMPVTIVGILLSLTLISSAKYLVLVLCAVELYVMFRQPILDEFDAPKE
jgi:hypothetical protein